MLPAGLVDEKFGGGCFVGVFMAGQCIFCGATAKLTHEHIRADWLKNYLPKTKVNYDAGHVTVHRPGVPDVVRGKKVAGDPLSRRVKCVCKTCNIGWMKEIQDSAKPIVVPMIHGQKVTLQKRDQRTLAAWIAMSVICSEFGKDQLQAIGQKDRDILYRYRVPPRTNWRIWIGRYQRKASSTQWDHRALLIVPEKKADQAAFAASPTYNTQSTTYTVGEMFVHAISSDWAKCVRKFRILPPGVMVELWPMRGPPVVWPTHTLSDAEAERVASGFFEGLRRAGTR